MLTHKTLVAWQRARALVLLVAEMQREYWRPWSRAFWDQLQRASLSVQLNIAEGYALPSRKRWVWFLGIAHASAIEALEVIELLEALEAIPNEAVQPMATLAEETVRLTLGLLKRYRGSWRPAPPSD